MFIIHILSLLIFILILGFYLKEKLTDCIPAAVSLLILFLYGLSFGNLLWLTDILAPLFLLGSGILVFKMDRKKRKELVSFAGRELRAPAFLTALLLFMVVTVCVSGKLTSWWDDYNFWATDVKSIFYLDGFADRYENVAAEFGDYPPGTQMLKWWFLHLSPSEFREGLMFAGYYVCNLAFLVPLLERIRKKNVITMTIGAVLLWLFPSMVEAFWMDGCCADFTMAVIYGAFLTAVLDREGHSSLFYYGRQTCYLMVLVLCKNTGVIWLFFGLLFTLLYHFLHRRDEIFAQDRKSVKRGLIAVVCLPALTEGSWLFFCLMNRRVAKLTGVAVHMATGSMNIPDVQGQMVDAFLTAFLKWPLHRYSTAILNVSPLMLVILVLVIYALLGIRKKITGKDSRFLLLFALLSAASFYSLNLISHLTIFAVETQYLEPFGMVSSIERYGAPFTIGSLYLIAYLVLKSENAVRGLLLCAIPVLLTADYQGSYRALIGYRNTIEEIRQEREDIVDEKAEAFLAKIGAGTRKSIGRVLYLRDLSDISWVRNAYVSFEAAPVSVMYGNISGETTDSAALLKTIEESHAGYLYVEPLDEENQELFAPFMDGTEFSYDTLYRITENDGRILLVPVA